MPQLAAKPQQLYQCGLWFRGFVPNPFSGLAGFHARGDSMSAY